MRHQDIEGAEQDGQPEHREDSVKGGICNGKPRAGERIGGCPPVFLAADRTGKPLRNLLLVGGDRCGLAEEEIDAKQPRKDNGGQNCKRE